MISTKQRFTAEEAAERGRGGSATNADTIVADDLSLAHLRERPDYFTRLALMEVEWSLARLSAGWSTTRT